MRNLVNYITWIEPARIAARGDKVKEKMVQVSYQAYCEVHKIEELLRDVPVDKRDEYLSFAKKALQWMYAAADKNKEVND